MSTIFHFIWLEGQERRKKPAAGAHPKMQVSSSGKPVRFPGTFRRSVRPAPFLSFAPKIKSIIKVKYAKADSRWKGHIREFISYIVDKDKSRCEERSMFNRDRLDIEPEQAIDRLNRLCGSNIALTKLILSPGDNSTDLVEYTRNTMSELERSLGVKLEWFAAPHYDTDNYHSHVGIGGVIPEQDLDLTTEHDPNEAIRLKLAREFEGRDLRLTRDDIDLLRGAGDEFLMQQRMLDYKLDRLIEREFGLRDWTRQHDLADLLPDRNWDKYQDELKTLGLPDQQYDKQIAREFGYDRYFDLGVVFTDKYDLDQAKYLRQLQQSRNEERERETQQPPDALQKDPVNPSEETMTAADAAGDLIYGLQTTSGGHPDWDNERLGDMLYSAQLPELEPERDIIERSMIEDTNSGATDKDQDKDRDERKHDDRGDR